MSRLLNVPNMCFLLSLLATNWLATWKRSRLSVNYLWTWRTMRWNDLPSLMVDRKLFQLQKKLSQIALVAGANCISFVNVEKGFHQNVWDKYVSKSITIPKILQRFYLFRGCNNSIFSVFSFSEGNFVRWTSIGTHLIDKSWEAQKTHSFSVIVVSNTS